MAVGAGLPSIRQTFTEWIMAGATILYVIVAFFQWRAIQATNNLTAANVELTKQTIANSHTSMDLTQQAIAAAMEGNRIANSALHRDRAWVVFKHAGEEAKPITVGAEESTIIRAYYTNAGRSPAMNVRLFGCTGFGAGPLPPDLKCPPSARPGVTVIGPGHDAWVALQIGPYTAQQIQDLTTGTSKLWLITGAEYVDEFGDQHHCRACSIYAPEQATWNNCDTHVECD